MMIGLRGIPRRLRALSSGCRSVQPVAVGTPQLAGRSTSHAIKRYQPIFLQSERRELTVVFVTGRIYVYRDVPEKELEAFRAVLSKGRYFNAHIRDHYKYREVTEELAAGS
jgi:hypothetical protein